MKLELKRSKMKLNISTRHSARSLGNGGTPGGSAEQRDGVDLLLGQPSHGARVVFEIAFDSIYISIEIIQNLQISSDMYTYNI